MAKGGPGSGRYAKGSGEPKEAGEHQKLIEHINTKDWWRTAQPDQQAVKDRGIFYASTYKEAEFYNRPQDEPIRVDIKNPLVGDEQTIASALGVKVLEPDGPVEERFAMDKKMKQLSEAKGYDSIALMTPTEYKNYSDTGKMPRSIELNVFPATTEKMTKGGPGSGRRPDKVSSEGETYKIPGGTATFFGSGIKGKEPIFKEKEIKDFIQSWHEMNGENIDRATAKSLMREPEYMRHRPKAYR